MLRSPLTKIFIGIIIGIGFVSLSIPINYPYGFFDSLVPVLLGLAFCTFMLSDAHAIQQTILIDIKHKHPYHGWLFLARALVALVIALPIHGYNNKTLFLTGFIGACFWLFFDGLINYYRDRPIFYVTTYYRAAVLDKFLRLFRNPYLMLAFKVKVIVLFAWLYLR